LFNRPPIKTVFIVGGLCRISNWILEPGALEVIPRSLSEASACVGRKFEIIAIVLDDILREKVIS
jgi:hypothetical protein